jgi:hypothetical protein
MIEQQDLKLGALLKLKRYEMPTEAFWTAFDADLRTKLDLTPIQKKCSWFSQWVGILYRFSPLTVACTVMVLLGLSFSSNNRERYNVISQPVSLNECRSSVLKSTSNALAKSVIQKKMVASAAPNCFSF